MVDVESYLCYEENGVHIIRK